MWLSKLGISSALLWLGRFQQRGGRVSKIPIPRVHWSQRCSPRTRGWRLVKWVAHAHLLVSSGACENKLTMVPKVKISSSLSRSHTGDFS